MCVEHKKAMESKFPRISPAVLFFITCSTRPPTRCSWYLADRNQLWCTYEHSHVSMLFSHIRHIVGKRLTWWHLKHLAEHLMCWRTQWPEIKEENQWPEIKEENQSWERSLQYFWHRKNLASDSLISLLFPEVPLLVGFVHFSARFVVKWEFHAQSGDIFWYSLAVIIILDAYGPQTHP